MGNYTLTGPFTSGAAPGIDAGFLNNVENCIKNGGMLYLLGSPYQLTSNPTITAGNTATYTCAGVGSIPSGALAVMIGVNLYSVNSGGTLQIYPYGGTAGQYVNLTPQWNSNDVYTGMGMVVVPLNSNQITCKAVSQNMVLQSWYIYAYYM
jgi:hypothetical protein